MRSGLCAVLVGVALGAGCQPKVDPRSPFDIDSDSDGGAARDGTTAQLARDQATAPTGSGLRITSLERSVLAHGLALGPPAVLQLVEVSANVDGPRFLGWRLVRLLEPASLLRSLDLLPGDVLRSVNGNPLSKPDELMALWTELSAASKIECQLTRGDLPFTIVVDIVDAPAPPSAPVATASPTA